MRVALVLAMVLIFTGTAHAQFTGQNIGAAGSLNGAGGLNSHNSTPTSSTSTNSANLDASVNRNSRNPGEFVPSTYSSFEDALATAKLEAELRPMTVAQAARLAQERKRNAIDTAVIQLDEDEHGKLVIASVKK